MVEAPRILLEHHLKRLKLPTFLREYEKLARIRKDSRVVRLRPALDGQDWNDTLMRDRAGEPLGTDDRPLD